MAVERITRYGWTLETDREEARKQAISDDPGQYAPVMIIAPNGETCTGFCGMDTGECGYTEIPQRVYNWLSDEIDAFWQNI